MQRRNFLAIIPTILLTPLVAKEEQIKITNYVPMRDKGIEFFKQELPPFDTYPYESLDKSWFYPHKMKIYNA